MGDTAGTRPSLLIRVRDPRDAEAWAQFVGLYGPLIYRFARKRRLQDADAADLTQTVLQAVAGGVRRLDYDPRRGSFRGWLFQVVRRQLGKVLARERRAPRGGGGEGPRRALEEQPGRDDDQALWDREYERRLFLWAAEQVRGAFEEATWQAFWRTAVEGKSPRETAESLGMTVGAVYTAKSRVLDRLRKAIQDVQDDEWSPKGGG
jgi:RNA polymerase sigma-70 factor (ECF subfamily)